MISFLKPILKETLWGGSRLNECLHLETKDPLGEVWGIAKASSFLSGPMEGKSLNEVASEHPEYFGKSSSFEFPITVKLIDAYDDLSIQVHPKNVEVPILQLEYWYIIDCLPYTDIIIGHNALNKGEFTYRIEQKDYHHLIRKIPIHPGDTFTMEAGTLHAISKGTYLLEVQQGIVETYRFYDYDRLEHGKKRKLQTTKAINNVLIPDPIIDHSQDALFDIDILSSTEEYKTMQNHTYGMFFVVLEGEGTLNNLYLSAGHFGFIDQDTKDFTYEGTMRLAFIWLK